MSGVGTSRLGGRPAAVLAVLSAAGRALSTTEVRARVNRGRQRPLVAEQVYRALVALQQAGHVRRIRVPESRNAFWQAITELEREENG